MVLRRSHFVPLLLVVAVQLHLGNGALYTYSQEGLIRPFDSSIVESAASFNFAGRRTTAVLRTLSRACVVLTRDISAYNDISAADSLPVGETDTMDPPAICPVFAKFPIKTPTGETQYNLFATRLTTVGSNTTVDEIVRDINLVMAQFNPGVTLTALTELLMYTWVDIPLDNCQTCRSTFQLAIAGSVNDTYAIFNYDKVSAEPSGLSGSALAGVNVGFAQGFEPLPFSGKSNFARLTEFGTTATLGRYIYRVSTYRPQRLGCLDQSAISAAGFQPLTLSNYNVDIFGGYRLLVQGPCLTSITSKISCAFSGLASPNTVAFTELHAVDDYTGICESPRVPRIDLGWTDITVSLDNSTKHYSSSVYVAAPVDSALPVKLDGDKSLWLSVNPSNSMVSVSWSKDAFGSAESRTPVSVSIVGYKKNSNGAVETVEFDAFESGGQTVESGKRELDLSRIECSESHCDGVAIGQIVVRLNVNSTSTTASRLAISSPVIPIGWYTYKQGKSYSDLCNDNVGEQMPQLTCPCNAALVKADARTFTVAPDCYADKNCWFSPNAKKCYVTLPIVGAGLRCCYDDADNLIFGEDDPKGGSFTTQYAPLTNKQLFGVEGTSTMISYLLSHVVPYASCCVWPKDPTESCFTYAGRHAVADNCRAYETSGVSAVIGDPHFATPDGSRITFNGAGEFWYLKPLQVTDNATSVQVRLQNFATGGTNSKGTVLTAVAMTRGSDKTVEIRIAPAVTGIASSNRKLVFLYGGKEVVFFGSSDQFFGKYHVTASGSDQSKFSVLTANDGPALQCEYSFIDEIASMNCKLFIPPALKNHTSGIIGLWNGVNTDDATSALTDLESLHNEELLWRVTVDNSLFTYDYVSYSSVNFAGTPPLYEFTSNTQYCVNGMVEVSAQESCSFDYAVTNSENFARQTGAEFEKTLTLQKTLVDSKFTEYCEYLDIPRTTKQFTNGYKLNAKVTVTGCTPGYTFTGSRTEFTCSSGNVWSPEPPQSMCDPIVASASLEIWIIIVCAVAGFLLIVGLIVVGYIFYRKKQRQAQKANEEDDEKGNVGKSTTSVRTEEIEMKGDSPSEVRKTEENPQQKIYGVPQKKNDQYAPPPPLSPRPVEYGQPLRPPPRNTDYGQPVPMSPRQTDYAPPKPAEQQRQGPSYGVQVLPPPVASLPPRPPAATANESDDSESESESDDEAPQPYSGRSDVV